MLRWGANTNLGRIYEAKKDSDRAIAHETQWDPTTQNHGNLLRARELVFHNPMAATPVTLPPAPPPRPIIATPARQPAPVRRQSAGN